MDLNIIIDEFIFKIRNKEIEIYNEFSLQHELGFFLRNKLENYKIQFERNAKIFNINSQTKHEIDIVIFNDFEKFAIELKFPRNGQYPEQMFAFVKDIKFMEELKQNGFSGTYCLTFVDDKNFYCGSFPADIYYYFRKGKVIHGLIEKPTGAKNKKIYIYGNYVVEWKDCYDDCKYYFLEIK